MSRAASTADSKDLPTTSSAPPRRRAPALLLALGGAALAVAVAMAFEKMRLGPPLVMVGLGGMTLVLAGVALWRVIDPLSRLDLPDVSAPRAPARLRELEREKQLVLKAIKEIELDYQMRKLAESDYREMIERYRTRAMRLISELEAGENYRQLIERELKLRAGAAPGAPAAGAAPARDSAATAGPPRCAGCDTLNDRDAQFCKKCGTKLVTS